MLHKTALVVGSTGIVGLNLASYLVEQDWSVYGLARKPTASEGIQLIAAHLLDLVTLVTVLERIKPARVYLTTWMRQPTEAENIKVNGTTVRNLLDAMSRQNW